MRKKVMRAVLCAAAAAIVLSPTAAVADPSKPVDKWAVDYGEARCAASRHFRDAANPVILTIRPTFYGDMYELLIGDRSKAPKSVEQRRGSIDLGKGPIKTPFMHFRDQNGLSVMRIVLNASDIRTAGDVSRLKFESRDMLVDLATNSFGGVIKALDDCLIHLRDYWNQGGEREKTLVRRSRGDLRPLFSSEDYPELALLSGQQGTAQYVLLVDETGRVAGCDLRRSSGAASLDLMGCQVFMRRAQFAPAVDHNGKPVRDTVTTPPISWRR